MVIGVDVSTGDPAHVPQVELLVIRIEQEAIEIINTCILAGRVERDELRPDPCTTGITDQVLGLQLTNDHDRWHAELGKAVPVQLDIDTLPALAEGVDLGDILHKQKLAPEHVGDFFQLSLRVVLAVEDDKHPVDITIVIHHDRGAGPGGQVFLGIIDLAAQLVPDLG